MHVFERLKSERERLGYSQSEFADLAHATRKTVFNWESGSGTPGADVLAAWADVGLDVLYVVTGDRSFVPPKKLTSEEETMLDYFHQASKEARKAALRALLSATAELPAAAPSRAGGAHSQHNSGNNAVQIGSHGGKVTIKKGR